MNNIDYEDFYDKVGEQIGWDFSKVKCCIKGEKWDFYNRVIKESRRTDILLDIGMGGGERVIEIAQKFLLLIGIDKSSQMIHTAKSNLLRSHAKNIKFFQMDASHIQFPNQFFNIISCRHSEFDSREVYRLLVDGGIFITQQVSEADKINLKIAFERGQNFGEKDGSLKMRNLHELQELNFSKIKSYDYNAKEYYQTPEDLLFLLKYTPIIPNFGKDKIDFEILKEFISEHKTPHGILTNSKRFMIIAYK